MGKEGNRRSHRPSFHFQPALLPVNTSFLFFFFENMASGVKLSDGVKHAYDDIKKHSKYLYAIFMIKGGEIIVEKYGEKDKKSDKDKEKSDYEIFLEDLAVKDENGKDACRYAFYDYEYQFNPQGGDSVMRSKLFLLNWCPETSAIRNKMLYASSFDSLKRAFEGVKILQANDFSDIQKDAVEKELRALDRT